MVRRTSVSTPTAVTSPRSLSYPEKYESGVRHEEAKVPVVTYRDGVRTELTVPVPNASVVTPPGGDVRKVAYPLEPAMREKLPPTLKRFTLTGRVAVVTGYVCTLDQNLFTHY